MIHNIGHMWRKVLTLSATFLIAIFLITSCKKVDTTVGSTGIDEAGLLAAGAIDTFSLETYSVLDDSIKTKNPLIHTLGEMYDPVFGQIKTSFYTQIRLESGNPSFGPLTDIVMDSVVLAMRFSYYTGKLSTQKFEVYELNEDISSDTEVQYYSTSTLTTKATNLVEAGAGSITPEPIADAIIDTVSVAPQMRIRLDTTFAKTLITEANSGSTTFDNNDNFKSYFKGLYITTNNTSISPGQGGIFGFNMSSSASKLTMYFKRWETISGVSTLVKKEFSFIIDGSTDSFNSAVLNHAGTNVGEVLMNASNGQKEFYAQAFGLRAVVKIPGLDSIPKNAIIHKAILTLPIQYQTGSAYDVGTLVQMIEKEYEGGNSGIAVGSITTATVSDFTKSVTQDIAPFVQSVVSGLKVNKPIYILPVRSSTSGDRIIFNGPNTTNKAKPKLYIIYTEF
ncbi:MAG: DUF4270 family protein [Flavobacteriales bacterium]|jgi:hypothetical protein